ncbi:efflux RND transporter periplasmic adaptor subunit [Thauera sp.]|jgi:RND family efflux transporter MFP subunit|uniref:efflux RND transporter periplasmic adaptor subunit n=1 Tax=Thauera sp. TaxID=1905334 RepID=UPI002A370009|nr:efflux RND transporter periplasmic adaptor subunit [Thauera sp.]MDX9884859.1 efflux RND transporter periplasmic adaptor subunit [Thauera sp.]
MRRLIPLLILLLAVAGFVLLRATRPVVPPIEARERIWRVEAHELVSTAVKPTLVLYGRIEAPDRIRAAAPVGGRIVEVKVRDGDRVDAGAVLARMDPRDLEPRIAQATADVERERIRHRHDQEAIAQERTLLQLADAKLARFERLKNARLGAESSFDQAREEVARVRLSLSQRQQAIAEHPSRLTQLQAKLTEARRDAERGEITAPFAARIGKVEVAAGDQVQPGQALLSLYSSDALYLRARVPAIYAEELRAALARGEGLEARAEFGTTTLLTRLDRISGEADARGVDVLLRLDDASKVPLGAFVNAVLERPTATDVFAVPPSALHGGDRIYLIGDGNRLRALPVRRAGERRDGSTLTLLVRPANDTTELRSGTRILATHLPHAIDGLAVEVVGAPQ